MRRTDFLTGRPVRPGGLPDVSWYDAQGTAGGLDRGYSEPGLPVRRRPAADAVTFPTTTCCSCSTPAPSRSSSPSPDAGPALVAVHQHGRPAARPTSIPTWKAPSFPPTAR